MTSETKATVWMHDEERCETMVAAVRGALAALTQRVTYKTDIAVAIAYLRRASGDWGADAGRIRERIRLFEGDFPQPRAQEQQP